MGGDSRAGREGNSRVGGGSSGARGRGRARGQSRFSRAISSGVREKPNRSRFDAMRSGRAGLRDHRDPELEVPAQDHLGGRDEVLGRDLGQDGITQPGALERAVALDQHAAVGVRGQQRRVITGRAPRDLVDRGALAGRRDQLVDLGDAVVAHPDAAAQALVSQREELTPQRHQGPPAWRPVHQPQVDVGHAEGAQALVQVGAGAVGVARLQLGGDEHLAAVQAAVPDGPADLGLVAVHGGGVDVPVAELQGVRDGLVGAPARQLPGAEPDHRHGDPGTQVCHRNIGHSAHPGGYPRAARIVRDSSPGTSGTSR